MMGVVSAWERNEGILNSHAEEEGAPPHRRRNRTRHLWRCEGGFGREKNDGPGKIPEPDTFNIKTGYFIRTGYIIFKTGHLRRDRIGKYGTNKHKSTRFPKRGVSTLLEILRTFPPTKITVISHAARHTPAAPLPPWPPASPRRRVARPPRVLML